MGSSLRSSRGPWVDFYRCNTDYRFSFPHLGTLFFDPSDATGGRVQTSRGPLQGLRGVYLRVPRSAQRDWSLPATTGTPRRRGPDRPPSTLGTRPFSNVEVEGPENSDILRHIERLRGSKDLSGGHEDGGSILEPLDLHLFSFRFYTFSPRYLKGPNPKRVLVSGLWMKFFLQ